ncbi:MAG: proton-conducting membrane transporter [Actinomycetota bacterium]|nr:proton-conducting membrane transporter [Actinomycetota bacterium]
MTGPGPTATFATSPHPAPAGVARTGDGSARLLAGPAAPESLAEHLGRLGPLSLDSSPEAILARFEGSGLTGRGGGHFPLWAKVAAARQAGGVPIVVVNAAEGEPASAKDRVLVTLRPHLVLDGAVAVAAACGADSVVVALHRGAAARASLELAQAERAAAGWWEPAGGPAVLTGPGSRNAPPLRIVEVPDRYIAGESGALASFLGGGPPRPPSRRRSTAETGIDGRPTVVSNAETLAHVGLVVRYGAEWFRSAGSPAAPGSCLVTLAGDVQAPGAVVEVVGPVTAAELADWAAGPDRRWQAVLLGGYAGTWLSRGRAGSTRLQAGRPSDGSAGIGCGLMAVIDEDRCGLAEAARLLSWLSGERAGQCGACSYGMPLLAAQMEALAAGRAAWRRSNRRIASLADHMAGRGLCSLPDGAVAMAESALEVFAEEGRLHRRRRCRAAASPGALPLPQHPDHR